MIATDFFRYDFDLDPSIDSQDTSTAAPPRRARSPRHPGRRLRHAKPCGGLHRRRNKRNYL